MIYDVTTISVGVGKTAEALSIIEKSVREVTASELIACWYCEIGAVGDIMLIRGFATPADLERERECNIEVGNPFSLGDILVGMTTRSYLQFPFLGAMPSGKLGPFYEVRIYQTDPAGIAPTIALWRDAVPHRIQISPLVTAMYSIDADVPLLLHVWPYASLDARQALRQQARDSGKWPPNGGLVHLRRFSSSIYLPAAFSPLT